MGWFWGKDPNTKSDTTTDPLQDLAPSLREFLEKESPVKYSASNPPSSQTSTISSQAPPITTTTASATTTSPILSLPSLDAPHSAEATNKPLSSASLYPDGRYAHIWSTYTPLQTLEASTKSPNEKIADILDAYKARKASIGRAALENCALEQSAISDCFTHGGWGSRMTMCREENRVFERCYTMQARFLRALGYLSAEGRGEHEEERVQMHADALYQRMMAQERAVAEAKEKGLPEPVFEPLLKSGMRQVVLGEGKDENTGLKGRDTSGVAAEKAMGTTAISSSSSSSPTQPQSHLQTQTQEQALLAHLTRQVSPHLADLTPTEREVTIRALAAEMENGKDTAGQLTAIYKQQEEERRRREEERGATKGVGLGGLLGGWFGR